MSVVEIEVGTVGLILDPGKHAESRGIFQRGQRDTVRGIILPDFFQDIGHGSPAFVIDTHIFHGVLVYIRSDGNERQRGGGEYTEQCQNEQDIHNKMFFLISIVHNVRNSFSERRFCGVR